MKSFILLAVFAYCFYPAEISAQEQEAKSIYFPVWSYHNNNSNIFGLSLGFGTVRTISRNTNSYGVKVELIGLGFVSPLVPHSPVARDLNEFTEISNEQLSEKIYGFNISLTGTFCDCKTVGLSIGGVGQYNFQINGLSFTPLMNFAQIHNGIQIAIFNDSYQMRGFQIGARNNSFSTGGIQIGLFNYSKNLKGFQIGLWNVNQKRGTPIINWAQ